MRYLVCFVTFWLNSFLDEYIVSAILIAQAMITGQFVDFTKHCLLEFGEYAHTHEEGENSMDSWTLEALGFRPTGNR